MRRAVRVWVIGLTVVTAVGCVTQGQYDAVVEQLHTIQRDLNIAKTEELALTQEAKRLESLKREAQTDAIAASVVLQRAKDETEAQRRTAEERLATLQHTVSQLVAEQLTLRDKLADAKGDTVALKDVVAVYRKKIRTEFETGAPAQPPQVALAPAPASPEIAPDGDASGHGAEQYPTLGPTATLAKARHSRRRDRRGRSRPNGLCAAR